jgi:hypothetical protein
MTADRSDDPSAPETTREVEGPLPADREEPVGAPVVRGDEAIIGPRAEEAVQFDPDDPESLQQAADTVRAFAENTAGAEDNVYMLRGAAACAALVRGEGSYKAAAERAGGEATVAFIRKWARVHDLPQSIRRHVAMGHIAPTAAKHIARVSGNARFDLAWAVLDNDLTVRDVRTLASEVNDAASVEAALADRDVRLGSIALDLPPEVYRELRRRAALDSTDPDDVVTRALEREFEDER